MSVRRPNPNTERRNSDQVPLTSYLVRPGTLLRIIEHGREPFIAELASRFNPITKTFGVHVLGWPHPIVLHLDAIKDVRLPSTTGEALPYAEYRAIRKRQREEYEQEHGTSESEDDERKATR